jgi:hypothetical protein
MKYYRTVDVWNLPTPLVPLLQPGQWVSAGPAALGSTARGRFWGVKPRSGIVVVAWQGNARSPIKGRHAEYNRVLHDYARAT